MSSLFDYMKYWQRIRYSSVVQLHVRDEKENVDIELLSSTTPFLLLHRIPFVSFWSFRLCTCGVDVEPTIATERPRSAGRFVGEAWGAFRWSRIHPHMNAEAENAQQNSLDRTVKRRTYIIVVVVIFGLCTRVVHTAVCRLNTVHVVCFFFLFFFFSCFVYFFLTMEMKLYHCCSAVRLLSIYKHQPIDAIHTHIRLSCKIGVHHIRRKLVSFAQ